MEYGIKPSKLATIIFEDTDAWKSDLDVYLNPKHTRALLKNTVVSENTITDLAFYTSCDYFYNQTGKTTQVKWVMPLGLKTRNKSFGLQYCPCCLNEDGDKPYFRRHWRLAFMTCCTDHSVKLHDRCPNCYQPIDIKRLQKREEKILYHPQDITHCSNCQFDLRQTKFVITSEEEYEINRVNFLQATLGYGRAGCLKFHYSNLYFEGIRRLLSFLICSPKGEKTFVYLRDRLQIYQPYHRELIGHNNEPERLSIEFRRTGLLITHYLLQDWPTTFINACKTNKASSHMIKTPYLEFPFWVCDALFFHIKYNKLTASSKEKESIKKYFKHKLNKKLTDSQIVRFLNYYF